MPRVQTFSTGSSTPALTPDQIAADPALTAAFAPLFTPNTAYVLGATVQAPDGSLVKAKTGFTSGESYSAANWTTVGATPGTQTKTELEAAFGRKFQFNVMDYGAVGDGTADDTVAFQAAATAAIAAKGRLIIPPPSVNYVLSSTINLIPASGTSFHLDIDASLSFGGIVWAGGSNTSVFRSLGWKRSRIQGVIVRLQTAVSNVVVWDIDGVWTLTGSSSHLTFDSCHVTMTSSPTGIIGHRYGHSSNDSVDYSYIEHLNCTVFSSALNGHIGWVVECGNALHFTWHGGGGAFLSKGFTNVPTSGAVGTGGGPTMYFYGTGFTSGELDFELITPGAYLISGGRNEVGKRFLNAGVAGSQSGADVVVQGVVLAAYTPSDGILFNLNGGSGLTLDAVEARNSVGGSDYTATMITMNGPLAGKGYLIARGCKFQAADPFYTIGSGTYVAEIEGCRVINASLQTSTFFKRHIWNSGSFPSNDILAISQSAGSVGQAAYIAFQGSTPGSGRARVGWDGAGSRVLLSDAGTGRDVTLVAGSTARQLVTAANSGNVWLGAAPTTANADGAGTKTIYIANASVLPSANPASGGVLYVDAGALKYRGSSGTVTTLANA